MRLDQALVKRQLAPTRSQAETMVKLGYVAVDGKIAKRTAMPINELNKIRVIKKNSYVSRAGLKLESVARSLAITIKDKTVLDVGSSTGGFTDYALQHGAAKVVAVDVGTEQMHPKLRSDKRVELHEQTDIRGFQTEHKIDLILIDVSFISLRQILPAVDKFCGVTTQILAMCKPQFEAGRSQTAKGVVKNDRMRRDILQEFEEWLRQNDYVVMKKADSDIAGEKGNVERFYLLKLASKPKQP